MNKNVRISLMETRMTDKIIKNSNLILDVDAVRHVLEDHMPYIKERGRPHKVEPADAYRFKHDLNAYLLSLGITPGLHWCYMRVNDFKYPWEFTEETEILLFPDEQLISDLISQYMDIH